jgi:hypothetical protein
MLTKHKQRARLAVATLVGVALLAGASSALAASVDPVHIPGSNNDGKSCAEVFPGATGLTEISTGSSEDGTYTNGAFSVTVTKTSASSLNFVAGPGTIVIGAIVKDGVDGANFYDYSPAGVYSDTGLTTPGPEFGGTYKGISHSVYCVQEPPFVPLTAEKTANATYERNVHWELTKTVDPDSHTGTAGEVAGDSDWTITATKVEDAPSDFRVAGQITIHNDNLVPVGVDVTDVLDDGTVANVACQADEVPANDILICTYAAFPDDASATLNTATITSDNPDIDGTTATAAVDFQVWAVNGDDETTLTDPYLGIVEIIDATTVETRNEEFPCSAVASDYTDGQYSYEVPNTAYLDGASTDLEASATVTVICTLPALRAAKTATGLFDRDLSWSLDKSVDIDSFSGLPGDTFTSIWDVDVDLNVSDPYNFRVAGTITVENDAAIAQDFTATDVLDDGTNANVICPTNTVPAGGSVECAYLANPADGSATLNTATVSAAGNADVVATAPVDFTLDQLVGDTVVDLTDPRRPLISVLSLIAAVNRTDPEDFVCPADDSGLYVNGVYTETFTNTAFLDGATTHLQDSASVTITCELEKIEGGHTIGFWFNAPAGQTQTLAAFPTLKVQYGNVLGGLSFANKTALKNFGNAANCSGTCTTLLQAQFIATAMSVYNDVNDYGDQCVAVPTYIEADGVAQIDDLLTQINVLFPTLTTAQRIELQVLLNGINNNLLYNLCP